MYTVQVFKRIRYGYGYVKVFEKTYSRQLRSAIRKFFAYVDCADELMRVVLLDNRTGCRVISYDKGRFYYDD